MPRGFFTSCVTVLFDELPSLDAVRDVLSDFEIVGEQTGDEPTWFLGFPELVIDYRPELHGRVTVERIDRTWPDGMGDPTTEIDVFSAWSMGAFGPGAFPGNLERAMQQAVSWDDDPEPTVERHTGMLRVRTSYVMGAGEDAPVVPEGADLVDELTFVANLAAALCRLPGALAFFSPSAELLLEPEELQRRVIEADERDVPPLDTFTHVRMMNVGEAPGWSLMDTVGADQVFLPDQEAVFAQDVDPNEIAAFLMDVVFYLLEQGEVVKDGDTIEGPGGVWRARLRDEALVAPPRRTMRWSRVGAKVPRVFDAG
ncbi:MAG: DUF4261 domain-containing protein [Sandaracinus sp.]|nr:DUF4261 domain-containing protein [Sandaracinus sp.]MCB9634050.1 DUF4261 domain-containing protein [Sandaracinus sp.]